MKLLMHLIFVLVIVLTLAAPAAARTINVTGFGDSFDLYDGYCSLREALSAATDSVTLADAACGGTGDLGKDIITLPSGTYAVIEPGPDNDAFWGDLDIYSEVELVGLAGGAIIEAAPSGPHDGGRVLEIHTGAQVILRNLIIKGGNEAYDGGGIKNNGWLALDNVEVTMNSSNSGGGGIATYSNSELYLYDSTVSANTSKGILPLQGGGGVWASAGSRVFVRESTISNNEAFNNGGGILTNAAMASGGELTIRNSTVSGNNARATGGGIYHAGDGRILSSNVTITNNTSNSDDTTDNDGSGGGIANAGGGTVELWNTIIAGNQNLFTGFFFFTPDCSGTLLSHGYNIIGITGACTITDNLGTGTDQLSVDPLLNGLADNGGPAATHDLQAGSPARDGGNPLGCSSGGSGFLSTDQRGYIRPSGTRCDIGAVEFQYPASKYTVDTNKDDGTDCTLRDALTSIMSGSPAAGCTEIGSTGVNTIEFAPTVTGTILLQSGLPNVTESLHILGPGSGTLSVSGQGSYRSGLFVDDPGNTATVLVEGLAFINGFASTQGAAFHVDTSETLVLKDVLVDGNESSGGCLSVNGPFGNLIISNSIVSNCTGRGIVASNGSLEISDSFISGNVSSSSGGGIYLAASTMNATDTTFSGNVAAEGGAALFINSGNLMIVLDRCTFNGNTGGYGGGIWLNNGELSIFNSVLTGNSATSQTGGGILVNGTSTVLTSANTTFSGNSAASDGGGLHLETGPVDLANITVTDNTADSDSDGTGNGGGLSINTGVSVALRNSILSGNKDLSPSTVYPDCKGGTTIVSGGFNLVGSQNGCETATWSNDDIFGAELMLLPLADYGGPTLTHAILPPSPAVDGADPNSGCTWDHDADAATSRVGLTMDQRASGRYTDGDNDTFNVCDIGAYEFDPVSDDGLWTTYATLEVASTGTGSGTVTSAPVGIDCGTDCTNIYDSGTAVTLTATASAGSYFDGWSGNADCSDGSVTMSVDVSCTATFMIIQHTLTVNFAGNGTGRVTSSPAGIDCPGACSQISNYGTTMTLTATPDPSWRFIGWSGDGDCLDGSITMNGDLSCTAIFANASHYTVTSKLDDNGTGCTLREAINSTQGVSPASGCVPSWASGTSVVDFDPSVTGTILLESDLPPITTSLQILGPGSTVLALDGNGTYRSGFYIDSPGDDATVAIEGLTIQNGNGSNAGGAILLSSGDTLSIDRCLITGNTNSDGGGIYVSNGILSLQNSTISNNTVTGTGGGISMNGYGTGQALVSIANTTISGNSSDSLGGGLYITGSNAEVRLANVTITDNTADADADGVGWGGGVVTSSPGTFLVRNSIIQGNQDLNPGQSYPDLLCQGVAIVSEDYNLFGDVLCPIATWGVNDSFDTDPLLGPLANNGGSTFTHKPQVGSPAIDGANPFSGCSWDHDSDGATTDVNLSTDQRGFARYIDGDNDTYNVCDIGAYEYNPADPKIRGLLCFPVKNQTGTVSIICF